MWIFGLKGASGFSASSTAEHVTEGIDGAGLTAIVTGATNGIGKETARVLALHDVHVVMGVRNVNAGRKVKDELLKEIPSAKIEVMEIDLNSLESVRRFASEYISSGLPLNILVNNAGIAFLSKFMLSEDNIEQVFAINHLGPFLLTYLLLETMKKTVRESHKEGRIVNVSSEMHKWGYREGIRFETISDKAGYGSAAYGQSKLCNILHTNELARRFKEEGVNITANSVHPGLVATNIFSHDHGLVDFILNKIAKYVVKNTAQGAATTCYVAMHPQLEGVSGEYFLDCNKANASNMAKDPELARKLWDFSLTLTNQK